MWWDRLMDDRKELLGCGGIGSENRGERSLDGTLPAAGRAVSMCCERVCTRTPVGVGVVCTHVCTVVALRTAGDAAHEHEQDYGSRHRPATRPRRRMAAILITYLVYGSARARLCAPALGRS